MPPLVCRSSGEGLKHSWAHVQPHYTTAATDKALEEAMACGEALSNPWNLKVIWGLRPGLLACSTDLCHHETAPVRAHMLPSALAGARTLQSANDYILVDVTNEVSAWRVSRPALHALNALPSRIPQVMSHSMVSPGFWCQAPKALVPHIGAKTKDVWFETTDRLCGTDATDFRVRTMDIPVLAPQPGHIIATSRVWPV